MQMEKRVSEVGLDIVKFVFFQERKTDRLNAPVRTGSLLCRRFALLSSVLVA
jgi:hypothetical protein